MTDECLACRLIDEPDSLPGGRIHETRHWSVEHCVGPLGVGTLIVKPFRHCLHFSELSGEEAVELGPLLRVVAACVQELTEADQTYLCLWSHAGWEAVHIHFVVQPAWNGDRERFTAPGVTLQAEMFRRRESLPTAEVVEFCDRARSYFHSP